MQFEMQKELKVVVVIPARYESSRLPGKPLIDLCGLPMIVRTYNQCAKAIDRSDIYVATDDERIKFVCESYGIKVLMTSSACLTGTDRVAEAAKLVSADIYINVQGDEPLFNPNDLYVMSQTASLYPNDVLNGYCNIVSEDQFRSGTIPKVVIREDGRLLYMSRAGIPTNKLHQFVSSLRQVCVYAFPKKALEAFSSRGTKTLLESIEDIEILRFLELGWEVRMVEMSTSSVAVDVPADVKHVESILIEQGGLISSP
jgi:3-deoxy-manno-octulosonate cytidylyltransferase (CMP-KDO synthetase)